MTGQILKKKKGNRSHSRVLRSISLSLSLSQPEVASRIYAYVYGEAASPIM
jgi:hypothetical protein